MTECLIITDGKSTVWSFGQFSQNFPLSTVVVIRPQNIFLMNSLGFLTDTAFSQQGACEKVSDSLYSLYKSFVRYLEKVVGFNIWRIRIVHARILVDKGWVFVMDWELFGSHEEHVLQKMGQT